MIQRIGYACINLHLKPRGFKTCRLNSVYKYGINYLRDKIMNNLLLTKDILKWNIKNEIFMYRVTSGLLPLVTHPDILKDFKWRWYEDEEMHVHMQDIQEIVKKNNIRLSMHPDQFTVLNSLNESVVKSSVAYLQYHYKILKKLGGSDIIIHTGGVYQDKKESIKRFIQNFYGLDQNIQNMLRLENDHASYNVDEVLYISSQTGLPMILDIHHHTCNHERNLNEEDMIKINDTWKNTGFIPKMHISSGKMSINDKRHHDHIRREDLKKLVTLIGKLDIDLMVEAKKKDRAVLKIKREMDDL
ncbi:MAG: UV DNA damage repair endonuclease UvsE [Marinisporobacter sp.]|jgi:UV DNA damage endonuclease|nr:UV DNA damage repair endonuclease UvsE [Marinisporobacter sp.]